MPTREISRTQIDAALEQAEMIRSAYIAGACKSMVKRIREGVADRQTARHGLASQV